MYHSLRNQLAGAQMPGRSNRLMGGAPLPPLPTWGGGAPGEGGPTERYAPPAATMAHGPTPRMGKGGATGGGGGPQENDMGPGMYDGVDFGGPMPGSPAKGGSGFALGGYDWPGLVDYDQWDPAYNPNLDNPLDYPQDFSGPPRPGRAPGPVDGRNPPRGPAPMGGRPAISGRAPGGRFGGGAPQDGMGGGGPGFGSDPFGFGGFTNGGYGTPGYGVNPNMDSGSFGGGFDPGASYGDYGGWGYGGEGPGGQGQQRG